MAKYEHARYPFVAKYEHARYPYVAKYEHPPGTGTTRGATPGYPCVARARTRPCARARYCPYRRRRARAVCPLSLAITLRPRRARGRRRRMLLVALALSLCLARDDRAPLLVGVSSQSHDDRGELAAGRAR